MGQGSGRLVRGGVPTGGEAPGARAVVRSVPDRPLLARKTGFLERHQHDDLAGGIVQGRFIAVAFVDRVLVDPRFRHWCALWEEYRKNGEVPVLAHEKAARDFGVAVPERKTVWDHLPYFIGLNCPVLYTVTALHYLLPVKGDAVEYGPVCSDGVAFDFNRIGIGEAIRNPRPAEGVNWLSDEAMKLFGPAEVMVRAAGSESAVANMYGIKAAEVRVLPLVTSQAGDPLGVAIRIGQGGILCLAGMQESRGQGRDDPVFGRTVVADSAVARLTEKREDGGRRAAPGCGYRLGRRA